MKSGIKECVKRYASKTGCTLVEADKAMKTAVEVIRDEILDKGGVSFVGVLSIEVVNREARRYIHPATGMPNVTPARKTLKIVAGKQLKDGLSKKLKEELK